MIWLHAIFYQPDPTRQIIEASDKCPDNRLFPCAADVCVLWNVSFFNDNTYVAHAFVFV